MKKISITSIKKTLSYGNPDPIVIEAKGNLNGVVVRAFHRVGMIRIPNPNDRGGHLSYLLNGLATEEINVNWRPIWDTKKTEAWVSIEWWNNPVGMKPFKIQKWDGKGKLNESKINKAIEKIVDKVREGREDYPES